VDKPLPFSSHQFNYPGFDLVHAYVTGLHACEYAPMAFDHDLKYDQETYGDYGVINGTCTEGWWECTRCGHTEAGAPPHDDFDDFV
jgi:hypothetical protein